MKIAVKREAIEGVFKATEVPDYKLNTKVKYLLLCNRLIGKLFRSSHYKKSFTIINVYLFQGKLISFNAVYDNKTINAQQLYLSNDACEGDIQEVLKDICKVDLSEHGMQGRNYLNFDVEWKL